MAAYELAAACRNDAGPIGGTVSLPPPAYTVRNIQASVVGILPAVGCMSSVVCLMVQVHVLDGHTSSGLLQNRHATGGGTSRYRGADRSSLWPHAPPRYQYLCPH